MNESNHTTCQRLVGRIAIVTGGTTGIGEAVVRRFAAEGAAVAFCARTEPRGQRLEGELRAAGADAEFAVCDVSSPDDVVAWVDGVAKRRGSLDAVVTCAGVAAAGPLEHMSIEDWNELLRINVTGTFLVCKAAVRHLRAAGGGAIVTLGSTASYIALPGAVGYGVTKAAALSIAKGLALELAKDGIRVNSLCPGATLTPATKGWLAGLPDPDGTRAELEGGHPLGRMATPAEQAAAAAFLVSDDASFMTGSGMLVDGGYTAR